MKRNKKKSTVTVQRLTVGIFELRLSEAKIEIENNKKTWKMIFAADTMPYVNIVEMMARNLNDAIETLCTGFYGTMSMAGSPEILKEFMAILKQESRKKMLKDGTNK